MRFPKPLLRILLTLSILASCSRTPATTASPDVSTTPPGPPAGFACAGAKGGAVAADDWPPEGPRVVAVRFSGQGDYDRIELEFDGTVPSYDISPHGTTFDLSPSEENTTLAGTSALLVKIQPQDWLSYAGPERSGAALTFLQEARMVENFEGVMQWGLGVAGSPCIRVSTLTEPSRLVIDVAVE
jgi:hypothetical protein